MTHRSQHVLLTACIALLVGLAALAARAEGDGAAPATVGHFDLSRVFEESPQMKRLTKEIEALYGERLASLKAERKEVEGKLARSTGGRAITKSTATPAQRDLLQELDRIRGMIDEIDDRMDARKRKFLRRFEGQIEGATRSVADARGLVVVLAKPTIDWEVEQASSTYAAAISRRTLWHASPQAPDVTDAVLAALAE